MGLHTTALRAITAVYFRRLLVIAAGLSGVTSVILLLLTAVLALNLSPWWWLLLVIILPLIVVIASVIGVLWITTNRLLPRQLSRTEIKSISAFTGKLFGVVEQIHLPYPVLLVLIGKDIIKGKPNKILQDTVENSRLLRKEYTEIKDMLG